MKTRSLVLATLILLLAVPAFAAPPVYPCYRTAVSPVIDGDVTGDPAWQTVPSATGFSKLGDGYTQTKQTVVQFCWTDAGLCLAIVAEEPDAKLLKPAVFDGGDTWAEDGVEIFVQPKRAGDAYQFAITAGGAKSGFEGHPDWTKMKVGAKIGTASYTIEALIPWESVNAKAAAGDKWFGNICRNTFVTQSGGDKFTSWAPLQSRFLEPENFATISFMGESLSAEQAAALTEQLNVSYRTALLKQVSTAVAQFADYRAGLEAAANDDKHGAQAQELLREWRQLERLDKQAGQADILAMRAALVKLEELNRELYAVKYGYLIKQLLAEN